MALGFTPRTHLSGYNVIQSEAQNFQNFMDSLGGSDASKGNDIFSMSYGFNNVSQIKEDTPSVKKASVEAFKLGTKTLHEWQRRCICKSSGNGFKSLGFFRICL